MSLSVRDAHVSQADRRARGAVSALFFTNGAIYANVIPRYPEIKEALGLSDTAYGLSIAALPVGALLSGLAAAALIRRLGSARLAAFGTVLLALAVLCVGLSSVPFTFAAALFLVGLLDSVTDVGQNAHGLRVQRHYGRSIINSFHAIWSLGAVAGGGMAALAIALRLPLQVHLSITAVIFAATGLVALKFCLPGHDEAAPEEAPERAGEAAGKPKPSPALILTMTGLALIAISATIVEDVGNSWAALYLRDSLSATAALAAAGYITLIGFQFLGRLCGDGLIDRFGQRTVARGGGLLIAVGMGAAVAFPSIPMTLLGFAAAGFGSATLVPAAMDAANNLPGLRPGSGLTVVTWLMRLGFLISPLIIGLISDATELRVSLLILPVAGILILALSPVLMKRKQAPEVSQQPTTSEQPR